MVSYIPGLLEILRRFQNRLKYIFKRFLGGTKVFYKRGFFKEIQGFRLQNRLLQKKILEALHQ